MQAELEALGLSRNEAAIYIFLLKKGSTTTGSIIKETGISSSRVYESLNALTKKGLVVYNIQPDGKHFASADPLRLKILEEERNKKLNKLLPELKAIQNSFPDETTSAVYEGIEGFKTAFRKVVEDCPEGETIHILGFSQQIYGFQPLRRFLRQLNKKSHDKNHHLKIVLDKGSKYGFGSDRESEPNTEVRYIEKGFVSPAAMDVFGDYVYIFLWEEKPFVFVIKNRAIADGFKKHIDFLFNMGKKS